MHLHRARVATVCVSRIARVRLQEQRIKGGGGGGHSHRVGSHSNQSAVNGQEGAVNSQSELLQSTVNCHGMANLGGVMYAVANCKLQKDLLEVLTSSRSYDYPIYGSAPPPPPSPKMQIVLV